MKSMEACPMVHNVDLDTGSCLYGQLSTTEPRENA